MQLFTQNSPCTHRRCFGGRTSAEITSNVFINRMKNDAVEMIYTLDARDILTKVKCKIHIGSGIASSARVANGKRKNETGFCKSQERKIRHRLMLR